MNRIPNYYRPLFKGGPQGPLRWQDEISGMLPTAMLTYFESKPLTEEQFSLIREYAEYYINAPCWDWNPHLTDEGRAVLAKTRSRIKEVKNRNDLEDWIDLCMDMGLDPF